jgi:hypothetical protein
MFAAWVIGGPLNLVVFGMALYLYTNLGVFDVADIRFSTVFLTITCSFGMALAIFSLRRGAVSEGAIFWTVLKAALLTAILTVVVLLGWSIAMDPKYFDGDLRENLEILVLALPYMLLVGLFFAIPAGLYASVALRMIAFRHSGFD